MCSIFSNAKIGLPAAIFPTNGKPLAEDARVAVNKDGGPNGSYEITIKKVQAGDAGTYSVVATNSFGKAECSAKIGCKGKIFQLQFV